MNIFCFLSFLFLKIYYGIVIFDIDFFLDVDNMVDNWFVDDSDDDEDDEVV